MMLFTEVIDEWMDRFPPIDTTAYSPSPTLGIAGAEIV